MTADGRSPQWILVEVWLPVSVVKSVHRVLMGVEQLANSTYRGSLRTRTPT